MSVAATAILVKVTPDLLQLQQVTNFVQDDTAGAIATFSGVTRNSFNGKRVVQLEYEAYGAMAEKVLQVCLNSLSTSRLPARFPCRQCFPAAMRLLCLYQPGVQLINLLPVRQLCCRICVTKPATSGL